MSKVKSQNYSVNVGEPFAVPMSAQTASTSFSWELSSLPEGMNFLCSEGQCMEASNSYVTSFYFKVFKPGKYTLKFELRRPWENAEDPTVEEITIEAKATDETNECKLEGFIHPDKKLPVAARYYYGFMDKKTTAGSSECATGGDDATCQPMMYYGICPPSNCPTNIDCCCPSNASLQANLKYGMPPSIGCGTSLLKYGMPPSTNCGTSLLKYGMPPSTDCGTSLLKYGMPPSMGARLKYGMPPLARYNFPGACCSDDDCCC